MKRIATLLLLLPAALPGTVAGDSAEALREARLQAGEALRELRDFRRGVEQEFRPLQAEIDRLREEIATLEARADTLGGENADLEARLATREAENRLLERDRAEMVAELDRFFREWETNTPAPWREEVGRLLDPWFAEAAIEDKPLAQVPELIGGFLRHVEARTGVHRETGEVVLPSGVRREGAFLHAGPLSAWAADGPEAPAGLIDPRDRETSRLIPAAEEATRALVASGSGSMPADVTGGAAVTSLRGKPGLVEEIRAGGIWIYPILAGGLLVVLTATAKAIQFARLRIPPQANLDRFLEAFGDGQWERAEAEIAEWPEPGRALLRELLHRRELDPALLEELLHARILAIKPGLEKGLPVLSITAATAPLLGLLGTVTGMIGTFRQITLFGTGDPGTFAGGISEALTTTEFGLIVAVPAVILYSWFSRRANGLLTHLERLVSAAVPLAGGPDRPIK